jgi:hypothetical protein
LKRRDQTLDFFFLGQADLRRAGFFLARQVLAGFRNDQIGILLGQLSISII